MRAKAGVWCWMAVLVWGLLCISAGATDDAPTVLEVGRFSTGRPGVAHTDGWKPLAFKKIPVSTAYELVLDADTVVVKATSNASASGLIKEVKIDPSTFPVVRWRWKIENVLSRSDVTRKSGDDYPARLYITFEYDPNKVSFGKKLKYQAGKVLFGDIPIAALNYIWDTKTVIGTIVDNAYTDFAKMIVVESGGAKVGGWVEESRNVFEDYRQAFGEDPPLINGVAIMTDTDNTKERAVAYYGDIRFMRSGR
ncbi:MAG TPA: DUF3047 domain-containing protein [Nitrospira sp.]|nr:DUF3047 domain-containing protein [Nitrospira sp.]